jgi:hypothetical protein
MAEISSEEAVPQAAEVVAPPAPQGLGARVDAVLSRVDGGELTIVLAVLGLCVLIRLLRLQPIEYYDDEVTRWHFVRQWFHPNQLEHARWTHHMARFGVNVPLFLSQVLCGRHARVYYVWPVASFTLQVLFVYLTSKRLGGRAAAVLAAIFLSVFSGMNRGACQLLPDAFGATAMILLAYLLIRYQEAAIERRMAWLVGAGLAFVWAYEIKESNLLFLPGAALSVWLCKGRFRDGVLFCAILFGAILIETLGFRIFTDYSSRFAIVGEAHGDITTSSLWNLFDRFTKLEPAWQMLFWMWVPAALWLAASRDRRLWLLVLLPSGFLLLITFLVRSIHPVVIWTRFYSRYFEPLAPLFVVAVALFIVEAARRAWPAEPSPRLSQLSSVLSRQAVAVALGVCALVGFVEYATAKGALPEHPLAEARRISAITNDAYRRNLPIVQVRAKRGEPEERRVRPLKLVYGIYLDDRQVARSAAAKNGQLPDILDAVQNSKRYSYVLNDARRYATGQVEEWVERGCAVVLREQKGHLNAATGVPSLVLDMTAKLPEHCKPPEP